MTVENERSWLLIVVIAAALVLCLAVAIAPLIWLFGARPGFDADDARVRILFKVDLSAADDRNATLESVRETIERRMQSAAVVPAFLVRAAGDDRIEVLIPEAPQRDIEQIRELVTRPGTLEFSLLANEADHATEIAAATTGELPIDDDTVAWLPVADGNDVGPGNLVVYRDTQHGDSLVREFLVVRDPPEMRISGNQLVRATVGFSPNRTPALDFEFDQRGAYLFQRLTAANAPRPGAGFKSRLAIILDGRIHSAPSINEMIGLGRGQITGDFTEAEVRQLAAALTTGRLPAPVEFVETSDIDGAADE